MPFTPAVKVPSCFQSLFAYCVSSSQTNRNTEMGQELYQAAGENGDMRYSTTSHPGIPRTWLEWIESKLPKTEDDWSKVGSITTLFSTIPQGLFAALLEDECLVDLFPGVNPVLRAIMGVTFFAAALAGKFGFIHSCNDFDFRSLAKFDWSKLKEVAFWRSDDQRPANPLWTSKKVMSYAFAISGSLMFAALSILSMRDTGEKLEKFSHILADIAYFVPLQSLFFIANMASNMLFFPFANNSFQWTMKMVDEAISLIIDKNYRHEYALYQQNSAKFNAALKPVAEKMSEAATELRKPAVEVKGYLWNVPASQNAARVEQLYKEIREEFQRVVSTRVVDAENGTVVNLYADIDDTMSGQVQLETLLKNIATANQNQNIFTVSTDSNQRIHPNTSWVRNDVLAATFTLGFAAICMSGYLNFWDIAKSTTAKVNPDGVIYPAMVMVEMLSIALIATLGFKAILRGMFTPELKQQEIQLLNRSEVFKVSFLTAMTCALGAMPNGYQAWQIAHQSLVYVVLALAASALSETIGVYRMFNKRFEDPILKQLGDDFKELRSFFNQLNELAPQAPKPSFKSGVQTLFERTQSNNSTAKAILDGATQNPLQDNRSTAEAFSV